VRADAVALQPGQQQVQRLSQAVLVAVQAGGEDLQVDPGAATAHAEVEAAIAQVVEQGGLLCERDRVAVGEHEYGGADP
jgi:hypothetical protein